jgi:hypothetical protein
MKNTNSSIFLNLIVDKKFEGGPRVSMEFQTIVCLDENKKWVVDCSDVMDIVEIEMLGEVITERKNKEKVADHFESMGINLWSKMEEVLNQEIAAYESIEAFIKDQTGIILPVTK